MLEKLNQKEIQTFISLIELVYAIAEKYEEPDLVEPGLRGLEKGLESYLKKERWKDYKVSTYVSWWIKTAIEAHMGIENEDTKAWFKSFE